MSLTPELEHLTILAEIDDLVLRVRRWLDHEYARERAGRAGSFAIGPTETDHHNADFARASGLRNQCVGT